MILLLLAPERNLLLLKQCGMMKIQGPSMNACRILEHLSLQFYWVKQSPRRVSNLQRHKTNQLILQLKLISVKHLVRMLLNPLQTLDLCRMGKPMRKGRIKKGKERTKMTKKKIKMLKKRKGRKKILIKRGIKIRKRLKVLMVLISIRYYSVFQVVSAVTLSIN
uniref:Uncharacterized protein n=1 Tax=Opuntia streptacantha TaxID=393608 RepID=A0A7C8YMU5_OPUST